MRALLPILLWLVLAGCSRADSREARGEPEAVAAPEPAPPLPGQTDRFEAPDGFVVQVYADALDGADALTLSPGGDVLATEREASRIVRLIDADHDGVAEGRSIFGDADDGLEHPHGTVFTPGAVFIANGGSVLRFAHVEGEPLTGAGGRIARLPGGDRHTLSLSADQRSLYVSIPGSVAGEEGGSLVELSFSGARRRVFASDLRDVTAVASLRSALFATVVADESAAGVLTRVQDDAAREGARPTVRFPNGSGPRALAFSLSGAMPEHHRGGAFVALAAGPPRVVYVPFDGTPAPSAEPEDFLTGFEERAGPRALLALPDGSLLVTDGARVLRISFAG